MKQRKPGGAATANKPRKPRPQNITIQSLINRYYGTLLTPKQQRAQARKDANTALNQSMLKTRDVYQRERERILREQYAQGVYGGLLRGAGDPGGSDAQRIRDAYAHAAGLSQAEQEGFIHPTTGQQQTNTDAASTVAAQAAGYEGDVAAITPGAATGAQQAGVNDSVLTYLASLPKGTFAAEAEAAAKGLGSKAAGLASEFYLREQQLGQDLRELQDEYTMQVHDLQAGRAGMFNEALGGYRSQNQQDFATLLQGMGLLNTQQGNLLDYATDTAKLTASQKEARRKAMAARGMDIKGRPLPGYYKDPKTGRVLKTGEYIAGDGSVQKVPQGWKVGKGGKLVPAPYPSSGGKGAGSKADKTRRDYLEKTRDSMLRAAKGAPLYGENPYTGIKGPLQGVTRQKARQYLMQLYGTAAISRYPGQAAAIDKMINQILSNLGFK